MLQERKEKEAGHKKLVIERTLPGWEKVLLALLLMTAVAVFLVSMCMHSTMYGMYWHGSSPQYQVADGALDVMKRAVKLSVAAVILLIGACVCRRRAVTSLGACVLAVAVGLTVWQMALLQISADEYMLRYIERGAVIEADDVSEQPMGAVLGIAVSRDFFADRVRLYAAMTEDAGEADVAAAAWEDIVRDLADYQLAVEQGFLPSYKEMLPRLDEIWRNVLADEDVHTWMQDIIAQAGMDGFDYQQWLAFYAVPMLMVNERAYAYRQQQGLPQPDLADVEAKILDQEFF